MKEFSTVFKAPPPRLEVLFDDEPVAELTRNKRGIYVFRYLASFGRKKLAALPGLPLGREHESSTLFPFFEERIPELRRPEVVEWLRQHHVDPTDKMKLLGSLAKKSVTDSFELRSAA
jgi:HipA-like protein